MYNRLMIWLIKFCLGVVILLLSTHTLVKLAEKISQAMRVSPLIIGVTVLALGTSLPELSVSIFALLKHDAGLGFGNIIGSNIVNIFMVLPAGILVGKLRLGTAKTPRNALFLLGATGLFVLLQKVPLPTLLAGLLLIILALLVTVDEYRWGIAGRSLKDSAKFRNQEKERFTPGKVVFIVISLAGIIIGGILTVSSVENISLATGYSTTILGLSLTAVVTSLPELLTTIFAQEEHQEKMTIGSIIGSNIYNLLFIGGLLTLLGGVSAMPTRNWVWLISATIIFVFILCYYRGKLVPRWVAGSLLLLFFAYLFTLPCVFRKPL